MLWKKSQPLCNQCLNIYWRSWLLPYLEYVDMKESPWISRRRKQLDTTWTSQVVLLVKNLPANNRLDVTDAGSFPGSGRSPGGGHDNPLQYSCLETLMDRGTGWTAVHGVAQSWTWLKWLSTFVPRYEILLAFPETGERPEAK